MKTTNSTRKQRMIDRNPKLKPNNYKADPAYQQARRALLEDYAAFVCLIVLMTLICALAAFYA